MKLKSHEYTIPQEAIQLSSVLTHLHSESSRTIEIPADFQDIYMGVIQQYLTYFASHTEFSFEPKPLNDSIDTSKLFDPQVLKWLNPFKIADIEDFRRVAVYFDLQCLVQACDVLVALDLLKKKKTAFPRYHVDKMTHASKEVLYSTYPMFK